MDQIGLLEEAENCRRKALAYLGQPEAMFLLRVAKAFEELNAEKRGFRSRPGGDAGTPLRIVSG